MGSIFQGTDKERAADFQKALDNPNIKAIWAARGGYGSVRILDNPRLSSRFQTNPKMDHWIFRHYRLSQPHS